MFIYITYLIFWFHRSVLNKDGEVAFVLPHALFSSLKRLLELERLSEWSTEVDLQEIVKSAINDTSQDKVCLYYIIVIIYTALLSLVLIWCIHVY